MGYFNQLSKSQTHSVVVWFVQFYLGMCAAYMTDLKVHYPTGDDQT